MNIILAATILAYGIVLGASIGATFVLMFYKPEKEPNKELN